MAGTITDVSQAAPPRELTVEVCIIGSGPAGATTAWELAAAGREVLVLEEGPDLIGPQLTGRDAAMYDQIYADRGGRMTADRSIAVLQGRVLGGGSVINNSDVVPVSDPVLRLWQKKYGLTDFSPEALEPFRAQTLVDLSANRPVEAQVNRNNALLRQGAEALGWKGEVMLHNRVGCGGFGTCLIGCPLNAKRNARFVALPKALEHGARVFTRARALRIVGAQAELKTVECVRLDTKGYKQGAPFQVKAKTVVVAANAIGSAALLLRSGIGNAHLGQHLSLQPQLPVTAFFDEPVRFFRGIPQSYAVTQFEESEHPEHGWWGFRIEGIAGTPGIVGSLLPELGADGRKIMAEYPKMAASLVLFPDQSQGRVRVREDGHPVVEYAFDEEQVARFRAGAKAAARVYLAAGATSVVIPSTPLFRASSEAELAAIDQLAFPPASAPFISAHQQGTVRFSPNEGEGAASPDGQVYGTKGVYVFDSSGFPTTSSSHTMAPIITVSRFLARKLL